MSEPCIEPVVASYASHAGATAVIDALRGDGIDTTRFSLGVSRFHPEGHDGVKLLGGGGAVWGALWGSAFGSALFLLPTTGPLVVMGSLAGWIASAISGAALGGTARVVATALATVGIPVESIAAYELEMKAGRFLVVVRGSAPTLERTRGVLASARS